MSKKLWMRVTGFAVILTTLTSCAGGSAGIRDFCLIYEPVYTAKADTEKTKQQCDGNNAVWLELCDEGKVK